MFVPKIGPQVLHDILWEELQSHVLLTRLLYGGMKVQVTGSAGFGLGPRRRSLQGLLAANKHQECHCDWWSVTVRKALPRTHKHAHTNPLPQRPDNGNFLNNECWIFCFFLAKDWNKTEPLRPVGWICCEEMMGMSLFSLKKQLKFWPNGGAGGEITGSINVVIRVRVNHYVCVKCKFLKSGQRHCSRTEPERPADVKLGEEVRCVCVCVGHKFMHILEHMSHLLSWRRKLAVETKWELDLFLESTLVDIWVNCRFLGGGGTML